MSSKSVICLDTSWTNEFRPSTCLSCLAQARQARGWESKETKAIEHAYQDSVIQNLLDRFAVDNSDEEDDRTAGGHHGPSDGWTM